MQVQSKLLLRKVPEVTVYFWCIKLLTTALGESTSDYFVYRFNPYMVVILGFVCFALVLGVQFIVRRYIPVIYWLAALMVAVFGTMAADVLHVVLGVPYLVSTLGFAAALAVVFLLWNQAERTLSIHSINTSRREVFYWATVLATFALGTAAGDLAAYTAHLGFFAAGIGFAVIFAIPALGYWLFKWGEVFAFWFAYIMTRPLGATFADWTGKAKSVGGLGWGDLRVMIALGTLMVILVGYISLTHADVDHARQRPLHAR